MIIETVLENIATFIKPFIVVVENTVLVFTISISVCQRGKRNTQVLV